MLLVPMLFQWVVANNAVLVVGNRPDEQVAPFRKIVWRVMRAECAILWTLISSKKNHVVFLNTTYYCDALFELFLMTLKEIAECVKAQQTN